MSRAFNYFKARISKYRELYSSDVTAEAYFGYPMEPILNAENQLLSDQTYNIAYLSMEFGLSSSFYNSFKRVAGACPENCFSPREVFSNQITEDNLHQIQTDKMIDLPIYSGGLGILAGDVIKSAADLKLPFIGVGILWNKGYFRQRIRYEQGQISEEFHWNPINYPGLIPLKDKVTIDTKYGKFNLRLWKYYVYSFDQKHVCPLILLDSNVSQHKKSFRSVTDQLYRSDGHWWKVCQRAVLGLGAVKALDHLGYKIERYHLNEGHAALAYIQKYFDSHGQTEALAKKFAYTCHTPVEAGHDRFQMNDIVDLFTDEQVGAIKLFGKEKDNDEVINLTRMCLNTCEHVNGVSQKHGEITKMQFPMFESKIDAITNGVHIHTWISRSMADLFDMYKAQLGEWRQFPHYLERISKVLSDHQFRRDLFEAHQKNKRELIRTFKHWKLEENVLTIGWARRFAGYKRPQLIFEDIEQLKDMAQKYGSLQIIFAGKAHPNDEVGAARIQDVLYAIDQLSQENQQIKILIFENYDTYFGKLLTSGVDVWLNNPLPPFEASGTSGMKAILNGVLQLSTLDGWVIEAAENNIGWIFGGRHDSEEIGSENQLQLEEDGQALYDTLQKVIKLYYATNSNGTIDVQSAWIDKMINCIKTSAFFTTDRMVQDYKKLMWSPIVSGGSL